MAQTNYTDAIYTGNRKYTMTTNADNTVSFTDATTYTQAGSIISAEVMNGIGTEINSHTTQLGGYTLWCGTQAQYDAITTKSSTTIYFIKES